MKGKDSLPLRRKRLLLYILLTAFILTASWTTYFLVNFDLNNYRKDAEARLSSILSLPVTLGKIKYNLHDANLALHIDGLQLGNDSSTIQIDAKSILLNLQWMGLFTRNFEFAKVSLVQPQVLFKSTTGTSQGGDESSQRATPTIDRAFLQTVSVDALEIIDGTLLIESAKSEQARQRFELTEFAAEITGLRFSETFQFDLKGQLKIPTQKGRSLCLLKGEGNLRLGKDQNLEPSFNLELESKDLEFESVRNVFANHLNKDIIRGKGDLHLHLAGAPSEEIEFQVGLSSNSLALRPSTNYTAPIVLKNLLASGRLQLQETQHGIRDFSMQIDESRLAGQVYWVPQSKPFSATVAIHNSSLSVPRIKQWIPNNQGTLQQIHTSLKNQGSIHIDQAQLTLREDTEKEHGWQIDKIKGELVRIGWATESTPDAEITSLPFDMTGNKWRIDSGAGKLGALQLAIEGAGEYDGKDLFLTFLDLDGEIKAEAFMEDWQIPQDVLKTSGKIAVKGHLEGSLSQLNLDLQANLSQLNISHSSGLVFPPGPDDKLALHGTLSPQKISLDHGSLKWSSLKGHISGSYLPEAPESLTLDALLTVNDLASVTDTLPLLKKLQLHGQADLSINQKGLPEGRLPEMTLTLREAGLRATRFIADLSHINGRVKLTETGMIAENMQVHLGRSPLTVQAQLEDFTNPRLLLDAKANYVHADDLVFNSSKAMLRDIDGQLEIDRDGLTFTPVDLRLDGGTKASVRGTISFHPPFDVLLDITSEFADVGEIVRLWTDRAGKPKERRIAKEQDDQAKTTVRITAHAEEGDLYGMRFHNASATITPSHDRLTIHPLHFSVGDGFSDAQVITDFSTEDRPTMMRVSGHAEDVDALEVYRELLNQKNIIRGKLRGDFFIIGETGANYLPSSYGNFSIQVQDGVLHEFPVLSKIFSLLNVSQLFALRLPDMDREGMPFNNLTANFKLDKGVLKTEDLKIESDAMNQAYIGSVNLVNKEADFSVAIHPLGTVDKIVSRIPVAGWLLTGEDKALLTAHFSAKGKFGNVSVNAMPLGTLSGPTIGLLQRTLKLPFKLVEDPQILWGGDGTKEKSEQK
jgi:hypothetical protein